MLLCVSFCIFILLTGATWILYHTIVICLRSPTIQSGMLCNQISFSLSTCYWDFFGRTLCNWRTDPVHNSEYCLKIQKLLFKNNPITYKSLINRSHEHNNQSILPNQNRLIVCTQLVSNFLKTVLYNIISSMGTNYVPTFLIFHKSME